MFIQFTYCVPYKVKVQISHLFGLCIEICLSLMILFRPKFMINVTILILSFSHFLIVMFLALRPMESTSLN